MKKEGRNRGITERKEKRKEKQSGIIRRKKSKDENERDQSFGHMPCLIGLCVCSRQVRK